MKNNATVKASAYSMSTDARFIGLLPKQATGDRLFLRFVWGENQLLRWGMVLLVLGEFVFFKLLYPYPDFFSDSIGYIVAARDNMNASIWPIGYSKFLMVFHWITHSALALVFFQYVFMQLAALLFYKTTVYFYPTSKTTRVILRLFLFCNPLTFYLANYVSSDGLFVALSLVWLTILIWVLQRPSMFHIIVLSVIFLVAFTFRYNALFYPVIAAVSFIGAKQNPWWKVAGILLGPMLVIPVIVLVAGAAKDISGTAQFPPVLGGWQWSNNALYIREYVEEDTTRFPTPQMAELDSIARRYYRIVPPEVRSVSSYIGNFYIRNWQAPLKKYMVTYYPAEEIVSWAKVAPLFNVYGKYIIKRHPVAFARYFMLPNAGNYFLPPMEKLELYNLGKDVMASSVVFWFDYPDNKLSVISKDLQGYVLLPLPFLFLFLNMYGLWCLFTFIKKGGFKTTSSAFQYTILLVTAFLVLNFCFSVFANIVVMRYQIFPMIVCLVYVLLLTDYLQLREQERKRAIENVPEKPEEGALERIGDPQSLA